MNRGRRHWQHVGYDPSTSWSKKFWIGYATIGFVSGCVCAKREVTDGYKEARNHYKWGRGYGMVSVVYKVILPVFGLVLFSTMGWPFFIPLWLDNSKKKD